MSGNEIAMTAFSVIAACAVLSALALSWRGNQGSPTGRSSEAGAEVRQSLSRRARIARESGKETWWSRTGVEPTDLLINQAPSH